jgi:6-phosphogluconolactonase
MIETFPDALAQAKAAADAVETLLAEGVAARGWASLVATGGRSPGPTYDELALRPLPWAKVTVTLSDERQVPPDAPEANERLVRQRLMTGLAAAAHFQPLSSDAEIAVLAPFDATLLGMGEDGHVASLIPGSPTLAAGLDPASPNWLIDCPAGLGKPPVARTSLSMRALFASRAILLLINGPEKRQVLARALAGEDLPVARLFLGDHPPVRVLAAP